MNGLEHLHRARTLLSTDPTAALAHANEAVGTLPLDAPELATAVVVLVTALQEVGMHAEVVACVTACGERFPEHVELCYRLARAHQALGHDAEMLAAFERCLALGEDGPHVHTAGAGSFLPLFELGRFAEGRGDHAAARSLYARAVDAGDPGPSTERLRSLPVPAAAPPPPARVGRPLTVVACIPGREFSGRFFDAWSEFMAKCHAVGINLVLHRRYDAVVYYARNKVAGGDVRRGPKQAPWGGQQDYDFMLWIDSDVIFRFEDFQALLRHKVEMVAGLYLMADNARFAAVEKMDEEMFQKNGEFEFLTPAKAAAREGLIPVDYCGFGFVLVRRGVFERLEYPWFRPLYMEMGGCSDFTAEDVGFCMLAKKAGIRMLVDPAVVVGHEKQVVLAPPPVRVASSRAA